MCHELMTGQPRAPAICPYRAQANTQTSTPLARVGQIAASGTSAKRGAAATQSALVSCLP